MTDTLPAAVWRPTGTSRLIVRLPYTASNRQWLHRALGHTTRPDWNKTTNRWEIARTHFRTLVEAMAERFGTVDVFIDSRAASKCDTRCRDAEGDECDCQCLGENHGGAAYWREWLLVGDTTLVASDGSVRRHLRVTCSSMAAAGGAP